jgi:hypothetical protein
MIFQTGMQAGPGQGLKTKGVAEKVSRLLGVAYIKLNVIGAVNG